MQARARSGDGVEAGTRAMPRMMSRTRPRTMSRAATAETTGPAIEHSEHVAPRESAQPRESELDHALESLLAILGVMAIGLGSAALHALLAG